MKQDKIPLLFSRPRQNERCVLSVYLNLNQTQPAKLNRRFEKQFKQLVGPLQRSLKSDADKTRLRTATKHVENFLSNYTPGGAGFALFFDVSDGFFWHTQLEFAVPDQIAWDRELLLRPLTSAMDELEDYAVVLTDRTKLRVFLVRLGMIQELFHEEISDKRVRHVKTTGSDHAESSKRIQRRADNQVRSNLREVVRQLTRVAAERELRRVILAGTPEITAELQKLLPRDLSEAVIGSVRVAMDATPVRVLSAARPVAESYESGTEVEKVNRLVTTAAKGGKTGKAVVGLDRTLQAVNSGRVWELVYSGSFLSQGYECGKCSALFSSKKSPCPFCKSPVSRIGNIVERAVEHAVRKRAKIEVVSGDASAALAAAGNIGAFLKIRTAPAA